MLLLAAIGTIAIAVLCWFWMQSTRASQRRVEEQNAKIIELLEQILKVISDQRSVIRKANHEPPDH